MLVVYDKWRKTWREGFAPSLTDADLAELARACETNDPRLVQGKTCDPPPLMCVQNHPIEAGCVLGFAGALHAGGFGKATVGDAEEFFATACFDCDTRLGEPAACRHFLNWFDDTSRPEALREMLAEIRHEQERRRTAA